MMLQKTVGGRILLALAFLGLLSTTGFAQDSGGTIAGAVRDTSGAILPGVTVEASSPALIEKVRTVVSDSQGQYRIIDLRPGTYTVTFTLPGFQSLRREGIELSVGVAVPVNAELGVGALEETLTVSGQTPLVDVLNTTTHRTLTSTLTDSLPASRNVALITTLIPGAVISGVASTRDVGGSEDGKNLTVTYHGSRAGDSPVLWDGMKLSTAWATNGGGGNTWTANSGMVEEYSIDLSGFGAESESSGVRSNQIPKQGGNAISGSFFLAYSNDSFQSENFDDNLRSLGVPNPTKTQKIWNVNPAIGGPIVRDKLWFFLSYANWGTLDLGPGSYFDSNPDDFVFTPDTGQPALGRVDTETWNIRLTAQTSRNSKLAIYGDNVVNYLDRRSGATHAGEATTIRITPLNHVYQSTWNWTASNRLLITAGALYKPEISRIIAPPEAADDAIGIRDTGTGRYFRAPSMNQLGGGAFHDFSTHNYYGQVSASYVTGSHNMKVGTQFFHGDRLRMNNGQTAYTFVGGAPSLVNYTTNAAVGGLIGGRDVVKLNLGIYAQDQWTLKRMTLSLGARFDHINGYVPEQHLPAVKWVGARDFGAQYNLPNWKDFSPRLGASYDIFGTGKTALKWNAGRYVESMGVGISEVVNPALSTDAAFTTRSWNDINRDFIPQESELGPSSNPNFGTEFNRTRYAPGVVTGWGTREWNWETMVGIQHQLLSGVAVDFSYHRRNRGNFRVTDNALVKPTDFDEFCVTSPVDPRLPDGGGKPICGLYNIKPTLFGITENVISASKTFGKQTEVYDGVDFNFNTRLPGQVTLQGGSSTGRIATSSCFVVDSPEALRFCDTTPPYQTQVKFLGTYPLPWWGLQASGTYQNIPGPQITAAWAAPLTAVTGLGRPLSGGVRSVTVQLVQPGTMFGARLQQVDFRLTKIVRINRVRLNAQFDLYNLFNANTILTQNNTFGTNWQVPAAILSGRLARFGAMLTF